MAKLFTVDFSKSLDDLQGRTSGNPDDTPTESVRLYILARQKPLCLLSPSDIRRLIVQSDGAPFILDLVFPLLEADPLTEAEHYPGDLLSNLIRADDEIWCDRPEYRARLAKLFRRALDRPDDEKDAFLDSLEIADGSTSH